MTDPCVLVTGCGAPGTIGTLWSLANGPDGRSTRTVGTDVREEQAGRFACDAFHRVPPADDDGFVDELLAVCEAESVDVVLPQVTAELPHLAANRERFESGGTTVAISSAAAIEDANDKQTLAGIAADLGVPVPASTAVTTWSGLVDAATSLGFPERPFVVKPPVANGQRGFRVVSQPTDPTAAFYEEKPNGTRTTIDALEATLGSSFPALLVIEYLPGAEYSVDAFRDDAETVVVPRVRDEIRSGISFRATLAEEPALIDHVETLANAIDLEYAFGFQFKEAVDGTLTLLECNPRIQGTMVASTLGGANLIAAAARSAVGEPVPSFDVAWGTSLYRYWGGFGVDDGAVVGNVGRLR